MGPVPMYTLDILNKYIPGEWKWDVKNACKLIRLGDVSHLGWCDVSLGSTWPLWHGVTLQMTWICENLRAPLLGSFAEGKTTF
jgi:hypothetical protein